MFGSDRSRSKDYKRALVATRRPAKKPTKTTLRSGGSIALERRKKVTRNFKKAQEGRERDAHSVGRCFTATITDSELSRVRTELEGLRVLAAIPPHPVQASSQPSS